MSCLGPRHLSSGMDTLAFLVSSSFLLLSLVPSEPPSFSPSCHHAPPTESSREHAGLGSESASLHLTMVQLRDFLEENPRQRIGGGSIFASSKRDRRRRPTLKIRSNPQFNKTKEKVFLKGEDLRMIRRLRKHQKPRHRSRREKTKRKGGREKVRSQISQVRLKPKRKKSNKNLAKETNH